jgi:hypothetical protein
MNDRLVPYYFGTCDEEERAAARAHVVGCTKCLQAFLALKEHVEGGALRELEPSAEVDARIRADVAAAIRPSVLSRARGILGTRVPLYQIMAAAAVVALVASAVANGARPRARPLDARVDFSTLTPGEL